MHEPGTDARIGTCDVWWAAYIGADHIYNIVWCICLSNNNRKKQCYTEKAPNAWHRQGTQKTGNTYIQPNQP